jgi:ATP-dependent Clp protease protease subunit
MIHQPYGGVTGQAEDIRLQAEQIIKSKKMLTEIIAEHTGQSYETVLADKERDKYFSAEEAKAYGLVDEVLQQPPKGADKAATRARTGVPRDELLELPDQLHTPAEPAA